jgi:hypothetical protein
MKTYTVHLFRSGRVWIEQGEHLISKDVDPPLISELVDIGENAAASPLWATAVLGKLLLKYVDKANQPHQHVCAPCELPHVPLHAQDTYSQCKVCGGPPSEHTTMTHVYIPTEWTD